MIQGIDHIGIAVRSLVDRIPFYRDVLGLGEPEIEEVVDQAVRTAVFHTDAGRIELLEPLHEGSPIATFLERRGEGIHHVALATDDISRGIAAVRDAGMRMIDAEPRTGAGGADIAFVHPKSTGSVLVELCQRRRGGGA